MKVNKFNMSWQLVRTKAKDIKDVDEKIDYVLNFLRSEGFYKNYVRVRNWLHTTKMAYKDQREQFTSAMNLIDEQKNEFNKVGDSDNNFNNFTKEDILLVLKDLQKRKYNFQFNKVPQDHISFVRGIENYLNKEE